MTRITRFRLTIRHRSQIRRMDALTFILLLLPAHVRVLKVILPRLKS